MENVWFDGWESLFKIIVTTPLAYIAIVIFLRASGKRTLSKMNAFDFVVTIALGSTLSTVALNGNIPLLNGATAILLFIVLQFLFTWLSVRVKAVKSLITSNPSLIFYRGSFLDHAMKKERITEEEVYSAARQKGIASLEGIEMIVLETTGDFSIIKEKSNQAETTYQDVKILES